jgi:hypothetical protein
MYFFKSFQSLAATWLEQSLTAMQSNDEDEKEKRETVSYFLSYSIF